MGLVWKLVPVMAQALFAQSHQLKMLMAAEFHTFLIPEDNIIAEVAFQTGRPYAQQAQTYRKLHEEDPRNNGAPESIMGPAHVQVFLQVTQALTKQGNAVGQRSAADLAQRFIHAGDEADADGSGSGDGDGEREDDVSQEGDADEAAGCDGSASEKGSI